MEEPLVTSRTPLGKRTNASSGKSLSSFRRSLHDASEKSHSKSVRFTQTTTTNVDKENSESSTANASILRGDPPRQRLPSLPFSLRASLPPGPSTVVNLPLLLSTSRELLPRPQTPKSILKTEMELAQSGSDIDESLLCSPEDGFVRPAPERPTSRIRPCEAAVTTTDALATDERPAASQPSLLLARTISAAAPVNPDPSPCSIGHTVPFQPVQSTRGASLATHVDSKPSQPSTTPITPSRNGVCMDLSDMFFLAAASVSHSKPPLRCPSTSKSRKATAPVPLSDHAASMWAEKQCHSISQWLNYTFYPNENTSEDKETVTSWEAEPSLGGGRTVDRAALRTLVLHQRMTQARLKAQEVFHSQIMEKDRSIILSEIRRGRIAIRPDRDLSADLTVRNQVLGLLFSYSTAWLRIGLETLFGEAILPLNPNQLWSPPKVEVSADVAKPFQRVKPSISHMKVALKNFIIHRVLADDKTLEKYTGGLCKVPSGSFEVKYRAELRRIVLYRLLVLIVFLDRAKESHVLDKVSRLFTQESTVKSTREVLLVFCREFLSAQGDFIKHLNRCGVVVYYKQDVVDELDYAVTNLATDLRDGVRLGRLTEILTCSPPKSIVATLRLPAVSRLQKLHNVNTVLRILRDDWKVPIPSDISGHHIVDGHREMVLKLMWCIIAKLCLRKLIDVECLRKEIEWIERRARVGGVLRRASCPESTGSPQNYDEDELSSLLLLWSAAVCKRFGYKVRNLSDSFADGVVICLLIHHYHPKFIRLDEIKATMQQGEPSLVLQEQRANCLLANKRMSELGGIPGMIPITDSTQPPDERSTLLCLSFLCSRLLESRREVQSCLLIQGCYRTYQSRIARKQMQKAGLVIWKTWRARKTAYFRAQQEKYSWAVDIIERFVVNHKATLHVMRCRRLARESAQRAAIMIQKHVRGVIDRTMHWRLEALRNSAQTIQRFWRFQAVQRDIRRRQRVQWAVATIEIFWFSRHRWFRVRSSAAIQIQRLWRGFWAQLQFQIEYLDIITVQACVRRYIAKKEMRYLVRSKLQSSATKIQKLVRGYLCRLSFQSRCLDIVLLQSAIRGWLARVEFQSGLMDCVLAQSVVRGWLARRFRLHRLRSVAILQAAARRYLVRTKLYTLTASATKIQRLVRAYLSWLNFQSNRADVILVQGVIRGWLARRVAWKHHCSVVAIQAAIRKRLALKSFAVILAGDRATKRDYESAALVQRAIRSWLARLELKRNLADYMLVQSAVRGWLARRVRLHRLRSVAILQAAARRFLVRTNLSTLTTSATKIQRLVRGYLSWLNFQSNRAYIIVVQGVIRGWLARRDAWRLHCSVVALQAAIRKYLAVISYSVVLAHYRATKRDNESAVLVQSAIRGWSARLKFRTYLADSILVQSAVRGWLARRVRLHRSRSVEVLQATARRHLVRIKLHILTAHATKIQRVVRGYLCWLDFQSRRADVIVVQSALRGWLARLEFRRYLVDCILVQSQVRGWLATRVRLHRLRAVEILQATARRYHVRSKLQIQTASATKIQRLVRGHLCWLNFQSRRADIIVMQSAIRGWLARLEFQMDLVDFILVQSVVRSWLARRVRLRRLRSVETLQAATRRHWCEGTGAGSISRANRADIVVVQSAVRGWLAKRLAWRHQCLVVSIQAAIRKHLAVRSFCVVRAAYRAKSREVESAKLLQTSFRSYLARKRATRHLAAQLIQKTWRCYTIHVDYMLAIMAAIQIQSRVRSRLACVKCQIQQIAVRRLQAFIRQYLRRQAECKAYQAVLRIQAFSRGSVIRRNQGKKIASQVRRLELVHRKARADPRLRLGCRTREALNVLKTSTSLSEIMHAVSVLEMATRYSEVCCAAFAQERAPDILFSLVRTCNRSLPHTELLHCILLTLTNVAKYDDLLPSIATLNGVDVFLDLVQMFRDKDSIFCLSVSLLERVVHCSEEFQLHCSSKENLKRLRAVHALCVRKLSVSGPGRNSLGPKPSSRSSLSANSRTRRVNAPNLQQSARTLQRVISLVEGVSADHIPWIPAWNKKLTDSTFFYQVEKYKALTIYSSLDVCR